MSNQPAALRLLLAGFGNIGRRLAEIFLERAAYPGLADLDVVVVGITTGRHGALANRAGVDVGEALRAVKADRDFAGLPDRADLDTAAAVAMLDYDVLVETSPLSVVGRGEPAICWLRAALERDRHVITCNKGPIAWAYRELAGLAAARGRALLFETTVMDGAPIFALARHGLCGNTVRRVEGILNSTTNLVLCLMEQGSTLAEAVAEAQRLGVAEADASLDLDGWDAAVKLACLANALMGVELRPEEIEREGIAAVTPKRLAAARSSGRRIKMIAEAWREGERAVGRVVARELPVGDPFALVEGRGSILRLHTDILGKLVIAEEEPDLSSTAYGVIADLFEVANRA